MMKHFLVLVLAIVLLREPTSAESPFDVAPTRYPFLPVLIEDNERAVCNAYLASLIEAYKGTDFDIDIAGKKLPGVDAHWILSAADIDAAAAYRSDHAFIHPVQEFGGWPKPADFLTSASLDIDGDGNNEVLAIGGSQDVTFWMEYRLLLFKNLDQFASYLAGPRSAERLPELRIAEISHLSPSVVEIGERFYISNNVRELDRHDREAELWRLNVTGELIPACKVALRPMGADTATSLLAHTPVEALNTQLLRVVGEDACSGSMHHIDTLKWNAARVARRLTLRPWALGQFETWNDVMEVEAGLDRWSLQSLWNLRALRALRHVRPDAEKALSAYYRDAFGLDESTAGTAAFAGLDKLTMSYFRFSGRPILPDPNDLTYQLHVALLKSEPPARIEQLLKDGAKVNNAFAKSERAYQPEPTLFYALESPALVDLLIAHGADSNALGNFGKTALMYAAQFNLPQTALRLLERGADPNMKTNRDAECATLGTSDRTALMYAAGNGTTDLLRLLLDRGADPLIHDSHGHSAQAYVQGNANVAEAERERMLALLADAAQRGGKVVP